MEKLKTYYQRHLPHYQPPDAEYHVVFRLAGSLPPEVTERLRKEREEREKHIAGMGSVQSRADEWHAHQEAYFEKFDALLDGMTSGPRWLQESAIADLVAGAIHYRDTKEFDLLAFTIMPNHVHLVYSTVGRNNIPTNVGSRNNIPTYKILQSLKRHTARKANLILHRGGAFWQEESYDHVIRDGEELERTIWYVLNNPVKAGLVESWEQWQWTYVKRGMV